MTEQELDTARRQRFRNAGNPIRTIEEAREFLAEVGFCTMFPLRHPIAAPLPSFIGAFVGSNEALPYAHIAFADPRAQQASDLMVRLLRERSAFESNLFEETTLVISAEMFPYLFSLIADRTPNQPPKLTGSHKVSRLALDVYDALAKHGASTKSQLMTEHLRGSSGLSDAGIDRALNELWSVLKTTRVDYSPERGGSWDLLSRWAPDAVKRGSQMSAQEALSAIVSRYLEAVVAADENDIEALIGRFAPRSRILETIRALIGARLIEQIPVEGKRAMLQMTAAAVPKAAPEPVRRARRPDEKSKRGRRNG